MELDFRKFRSYRSYLYGELKKLGELKFRKFCPTRPEGAEALSPGQRLGYNSNRQGAL